MPESWMRTSEVANLSGNDHLHFVHPQANVDPVGKVTIGQRTRIWQFASVIRGTILGDDCNVAHGACLDGPWFGDRCIICHNVAMGPGFKIGDDVFIGPGVVFCNDMWPSTKKDFGQGWSIEPFQQGQVTIEVGSGAIIGANATILPGIRIGKGSVVAAGAVVAGNIPEGMLWTREGSVRTIPPLAKLMRMKLLTTLAGGS